jgi:hypothetical protein
MGTTEKNIQLLLQHRELTAAMEKALQKVSKKLIAETKGLSSYLVISDEAGNIERLPAQYL